jgi:calcineurin-like phosphoesterase family protein
MNETMVANWNAKVSKGDTVYHLGDFAFARDYQTVEKWAKRLNGHIHLIQGNHDGKEVRRARCWAWTGHYKEIKIGGQKIILFHYAQRTWNGSHRGSWMLYGHSHGTLKRDWQVKSFDVGVDVHNFTPLSFEEVEKQMALHRKIPQDHHGRGISESTESQPRPPEASAPPTTGPQHP